MTGGGNAQPFLLRPKFTNEVTLRKKVIWVSCFTGSGSTLVLPQDMGLLLMEALKLK